MWEQIPIAKSVADCSEQVQRAMPRDQILMAGGSEMSRVWLEPPLRLDAEDCVQGFQHGEDASDIGGVAGVDHINIEGAHGSAVHGSG